MRPSSTALAAAGVLLLAACRSESATPDGTAAPPAGDPARAEALADTLGALVADAYDFTRPDPVARLMALYSPTDPVVSAAAGRVTTSRAALQLQIQRFWERVGQNMRDPRFVLGPRHVTALGADAAVLTTTYAIVHRTPEDRPHTLRGAWTAVFERRGGRWVIVQEHLSDPPAGPAPAPAAP
ncbi:nuclear transport factor 2 family protein [Roseisolibacter sp. H3M3-2]|uniref:YybH family protein n=1 Tax=Roseisolibacter sp. H3M3-2 TaxID=3031323 RepID=UPI0023DC9179|nr:nuclear transport factor 2 family protein [Roseisolibacter sp. H3M3-2]MDF1505994.1 nuclear transport factor 2 family protein [Roseisolibacter sp. H3M3-2]